MAKENTLFVLDRCHACHDLLEVVNSHPAWTAHTEIVEVSSTEGYGRMRSSSVVQTPTLLTRDDQRISSPTTIARWLLGAYGE